MCSVDFYHQHNLICENFIARPDYLNILLISLGFYILFRECSLFFTISMRLLTLSSSAVFILLVASAWSDDGNVFYF